ncbi:MAG TPA: SirB2 family protein, partial [Casimicrobiaceae bacterium]|nr:SirB2 family protein [Casimicrobiaceae bacterium]
GVGAAPWIGAKVVALVVYIALGMIALKRGRTFAVRAAAFFAALATFGYIVSVAITKSPWGALARL